MLPRLSRVAFGILMLAACCLAQAAPLRVLIVSDDPAAATALAGPLKSAGAKVTQASAVDPSALTSVDSVLLYGAKFNALAPEGQKALATFAQHGGGIVAVRGGIASGDAAWGKSVLGGAWTSESQKFRNKMLLTIRTDAHPITLDASTFDIEEETIYDLSLNDNIFVLSSAFTPKVTNTRNKNAKSKEGRASVYDIQPQVWAYEAADHRAVVILPGADVATLSHATIRAFIARGLVIALTAKLMHQRTNQRFLSAVQRIDQVHAAGGAVNVLIDAEKHLLDLFVQFGAVGDAKLDF